MFSEYLGSVLECQGKECVSHDQGNEECGRIAKQIYIHFIMWKKRLIEIWTMKKESIKTSFFFFSLWLRSLLFQIAYLSLHSIGGIVGIRNEILTECPCITMKLSWNQIMLVVKKLGSFPPQCAIFHKLSKTLWAWAVWTIINKLVLLLLEQY